MVAKKIGQVPFTTKDKHGNIQYITLENVRYVPALGRFHLFSLTKATSKGFHLGNEGETIYIKKGKIEIRFNHKLNTKTGHIMAAKLTPRITHEETVCNEDTALKVMEINDFHKRMGHIGLDLSKKIAKHYGIELNGNYKVCEACAQAKARQSNLGHGKIDWSWMPGRVIGIDISSIKHESYGGAKFWLLCIDYATDWCWSYFLKKKSDVGEKLVQLLNELSQIGVLTQTIRCDNAPENYEAEKLCKKNNIHANFEYTAPNTPQQNGKVERKFATLYGRVRACFNDCNMEKSWRNHLWAECASHCTNLENLGAKERNKIDIPWSNEKDNIKMMNALRKFGEKAVVRKSKPIQAK